MCGRKLFFSRERRAREVCAWAQISHRALSCAVRRRAETRPREGEQTKRRTLSPVLFTALWRNSGKRKADDENSHAGRHAVAPRESHAR